MSGEAGGKQPGGYGSPASMGRQAYFSEISLNQQISDELGIYSSPALALFPRWPRDCMIARSNRGHQHISSGHSVEMGAPGKEVGGSMGLKGDAHHYLTMSELRGQLWRPCSPPTAGRKGSTIERPACRTEYPQLESLNLKTGTSHALSIR